MAKRRRSPQRKRVGRVSYYQHHGAWYLYYRDGQRPVRQRVADDEATAAQIAAQVNAQLASSAPTTFSFQSITIEELRRCFLTHHEQVLKSSLATVNRYRTATQHLENFAREKGANKGAHELNASHFVVWLRQLEISPNGHPHTEKRSLRDKGLRYIIDVCRSLYAYAAKHRHLPPYADNPFLKLDIDRMRIEDAKPIYVFDHDSELAFFKQADDWAFPVHLVLAKTGIRVGELIHLQIEDLDLDAGWLHIRNKTALGWKVKTRRERMVPLIQEVSMVLKRVMGDRTAGPLFLRHHFNHQESLLGNVSQDSLEQTLRDRLKQAAAVANAPLTPTDQARLARSVWQDAGAIKADRVRTSYIRTAKRARLPAITCPKSWRHTFAMISSIALFGFHAQHSKECSITWQISRAIRQQNCRSTEY